MAELDPTAITLAPEEEPFTMEPIINAMLSTRRSVPGSIFIVEGIDVVPLSETSGRRAVRLLLGDGEVCVQAVLNSSLFGAIDREEIYVGSYVRADDFVMRFEEPSDYDENTPDPEAETVYLIINELQTVGWNETYVALWKRHQKGKGVEPPAPQTPPKEDTVRPERPTSWPGDATTPDSPCDVTEQADDLFDAYEAMTFPSRGSTTPGKGSATTTTAATQPIALPHNWRDQQQPLKLTTLRSIPYLPYAQNWSVNVLGIVVSLSAVEPSHLPPGKQRTARIADPSTAKHVHLTVFLDPEGFNPKAGSAVLLTGVKNHRFDGGSLKKYASDVNKLRGQRWWFEDPWEMGWLDVKGIKAWWADMSTFE